LGNNQFSEFPLIVTQLPVLKNLYVNWFLTYIYIFKKNKTKKKINFE